MKKIFVLLSFLTIISCDKEVSVSPPDEEAAKVFLYVTSYPSGALIFKNGRYSGKRTPDTLKFLEFGEYEIKLKMDYFRDTTFIFNISEEKTETIIIDYSKNPLMRGSVYCVSSPLGAKVYINDSLTSNIANDTVNGLLPGTYKFRYSYPEHRDASGLFTVRSGKVVRAALTLQDTSIWVNYNHNNSSIGYDYLNCIVIDKDNIKWIGTEGVGVIKFDEKDFSVYSPPIYPIPSGLVTAIDIDENNIKWFAGYGGIARFDGYNWQVFRQWNSPLPSDLVEDIKCEPITGNIWITTHYGLAKYNGYDTWEIFTADSLHPDYPPVALSTIEIDAANLKWLGTQWNGLYIYDNFNFKSISVGFPPNEGEFPNDNIKCSAIGNDGELWFGHSNISYSSNIYKGGLSWYDGSKFIKYTNLFSFDLIYCIYVDDNNVKWVGTNTGLYYFTNTNSIKVFVNTNSGIMSNDVKDVIMDKNGVMWFATAGGGLIKYKGARKK
ncbi:MAG: PEGA domain-containing protein [bacterium]